MLNISDLKTDLQSKFQEVDCIEVPQKYISELHKTIKTLTKLLNIRIRTDMPNLSINHFKETMTELLKISKNMANQVLHKQSQSLQETQRQQDLEKRLFFLEENIGNQLKELTQQNAELQNQIDILIKIKEEYENSKTNIKEQELQIKQLKHEKDAIKHEKEQLKSQNSNLQSLIRQLKEEKGSKIEKKLKVLKEEVSHVSLDYQRKLEERDVYIERLEKELSVVKSELEMSEDYKMLTQSSKKLQKTPEK